VPRKPKNGRLANCLDSFKKTTNEGNVSTRNLHWKSWKVAPEKQLFVTMYWLRTYPPFWQIRVVQNF